MYDPHNMLRSRGRVFCTIALLEKVPWSVTTTSECKSGPFPVAGGGGSSEPSEPPLGTGLNTEHKLYQLLELFPFLNQEEKYHIF